MIGSIINKAYKSVITFGILLFSNYVGNDPSFIDTQVEVNNNVIIISSILNNAFDNDFDDIFSSGIIIDVTFEVEVSHRRSIIIKTQVTNSAVYDFEQNCWFVRYDESNTVIPIYDIFSLKQAMSILETRISLNSNYIHSLDISINAKLPVIHISSIQKDFDLMVLWKQKQPQERFSINLN